VERAYREFKIGAGYSTEEEFRGQVEWRHLNWLGGGRRLAVQGKYSAIVESGAVELIQPHFLTPTSKAVLNLKYEKEEEDTFDRNLGRFAPRVDHQFSPSLSGFVGFRVEYDNLSNIAPATVTALGGVRKEEFLWSGDWIGLEYRKPVRTQEVSSL
jgi:outer membrane protein assembly factor BamA